MRVRPRRRRRPLDPWARSGLLLMVAGGVMSAYPSGSRAQSVESVAREVVDLEADTASLLELRTASDQHAAMESYREKLLVAEAERAAAEKRRLAGGPPKTPAHR